MNSYEKLYTLLVEGKPPRSGAIPAFEKQHKAGKEQINRGVELAGKAKEAEESDSYIHRLHGVGMRKLVNKLLKTAKRNLQKAQRSYDIIPPKKKVDEVAPPYWGHTKTGGKKSVKVGGTAEAMKQAQARGDIPKKYNIFALMWSMKNKGYKPHYKPNKIDVKKKKYKNEETLREGKQKQARIKSDKERTKVGASSSNEPRDPRYSPSMTSFHTSRANVKARRDAVKKSKAARRWAAGQRIFGKTKKFTSGGGRR